MTIKTRVLFVSSTSFTPDPRAEKQMNVLNNNGATVSALGWDRGKSKSYVKHEGNITFHEIGIKSGFGTGIHNLWPMIKWQFQLIKKLLQIGKNIDVIQAVNLDSALACILYAKIFSKKFVYDIYDYYADSFPIPHKLKNFVRSIETKIINNSDLVFLPIDSRIQQIQPAKPRHLKIIYNTPEDTQITKNKFNDNYKNGKLNISYVGIIQENRFLNQLVNLANNRDDIFLHIGGFGDNTIIEQMKKSKNIEYYGKLNYKDSLNVSSLGDIMVAMYNPTVTNHKFSAPNKLFESMMLSKPVIIGEGMGLDKFVNKYDIGYLCPYSQKAFNLLIDKLLTKPRIDLINKGKVGRELYEKKYKWEVIQKKVLEGYIDILGGKGEQ